MNSALLYIARRFLIAHRRYLFARFLTGVAVAGVALGVFAMTLVLAIMSGFRTHLEQKLLGFAPHVTVTSTVDADDLYDRLRPLIASYSTAKRPAIVVPIVEGEAIIQPVGAGGFADQGVKIIGIDPQYYAAWKSVKFHFVTVPADTRRPGVLLGNELSFNAGIDPGNAIRLIAPLGIVTPAGDLGASVREYQALGSVRTGFYEHDTKLVVLSPDEATALLGQQAARKWYAYIGDPMRAGVLADELRRRLGPDISVVTWQEQNQKLFGALRLERVVMTVLLMLMVLIASCSICGVLFMQVAWRRRDLAMLAAIGASQRQLRRIVLNIGTWIGVVGSATGLGMAIGTGMWLQRHPITLPASFYLDHLPVEFHPGACALIAIFGVLLAVAAAGWPAHLAARLTPAEALRYE